MDQTPVVFDGVWKKFRRGQRHDSLRDLLPAMARRLRRQRCEELGHEDFWALRDVSFAVRRGEALGIIGPNGAGKSTTLKLLTRILKPTHGRASLQGRVGALIELAAGFHPDLTGRDNVYLQGAIMGMKRREIAARFDEIVEFAGVAPFIDTPVKRYSSGMTARLGFAIAAHLDPDVLLIDEVLAVGDIAFQQRCYQKLEQFAARGAAVVFVSHNLAAVSALCRTVLVLRGGEVHTRADTATGVAAYAAMLRSDAQGEVEQQPGETLVALCNRRGEPVSDVTAGEDVIVRARVAAPRPVAHLASAIRIRRVDTGEAVFFTLSRDLGCDSVAAGARQPVEFEWRFRANLGRGHYSLEFIALDDRSTGVLIRINPAVLFSVHETESERATVYLAARCSARHGGSPLQEAAAGKPEPVAGVV